MCACCCHVSSTAMASMSAMAAVKLTPPVVPLQLTALATLCDAQAQGATRNDLKLASLLGPVPKVNMKINGQLASLALKLNLMGQFNLMDPIALAAQAKIMANSLNTSVAPMLKAMLKIDVAAVMKLSVVAKLMAQLNLAGLDPLSPGFSAAAMAKLHMPPPPSIILPPPAHLPNLTLLATLPKIAALSAALNIPLDDPAAASRISASLSAMASIKPPTLSVSLSAMLKMAAVVSALATITETFGAAAFTPAGLVRINLMVKAVAALPPIPPIDLSGLDVLPKFEDIKMGEEVLGSGLLTASIVGLKPPSIPISVTLSAAIAMQAALSAAVKTPPLAYCTNCGG